MRTTRLFFTLLTVCLLLLPAAAVGAAPAAPADYRDILVKAGENLLNLKSYHVVLAAEGSMLMDGQTRGFVAGGQADVQLKPLLMRNTLTASLGAGSGKSTYAMTQYLEESGGKFVLYSYADNKWSKQVLASPGGNYGDFRKYFDGFVRGISGAKLVQETDDKLVLEAAVGAGCLQEAVERAMSGVVGRKIKLPDGLFDDLGDIRYQAVIAKDSLQITEVSVNLAEFANSLAQAIIDTMRLPEDQKALAEESLRSVKIKIKVSLSRFDAVEPIAIPREARNAPAAPSAGQ